MAVPLPALRVKSHWFKSDQPRSAQQHASAMAFIVWRTAQQMLRRMRGADFDIDAGEPYFAFMREVLVFLIAVTDRIAYARLDGATRQAFTTELVLRLADTLQDNEAELLGAAPGTVYRDRFIDMVNEVQTHYAEFGADPQTREEDGFEPDFGFYRYLGHRLEPTLPEKDRRWVLDQVMAVEAPQSVEVVQSAMRNLFDTGPRPRRRASMRGD
jgi:hypothetical protein